MMRRLWFILWSTPALMVGVLFVGTGRAFKWAGEGLEAAGQYMIDMCAAAIGFRREKQEGGEG